MSSGKVEFGVPFIIAVVHSRWHCPRKLRALLKKPLWTNNDLQPEVEQNRLKKLQRKCGEIQSKEVGIEQFDW